MKFLIILVPILFAFSCSRGPEIVEVAGNTMGTYYVVKAVGEDLEQEELALAVEARLVELNKVFSTYDPSSELSLINKSENEQHELSDQLLEVIKLSLQISERTEGYFDVTVGPLVNSWGFGPGGIQRRPQKEKIAELLTHIGFEKIKIDGKTLARPPGTYIDLSAIAKGYGVDKIVELLQQKKAKAGLVEIGGEVRTFGRKSEKSSWMIGIEQPVESKGGVQRIIPLENMAIATSGSYRNFRKYGEQVFSHTIDPKTGHPVNHTLISVSILAKTCAEADGWATAMLALGPEKGLELANEKDILAYFMLKEGDKVYTKSSVGFKKYLQAHQVSGVL